MFFEFSEIFLSGAKSTLGFWKPEEYMILDSSLTEDSRYIIHVQLLAFVSKILANV